MNANKINAIIEHFEKDLDEWLEGIHDSYCVARNEGQNCCLDKGEKGREFVIEFMKRLFN